MCRLFSRSKEYFEENGMDVDGMTLEELEDASEVFPLPNGQYLIVEASEVTAHGNKLHSREAKSFFLKKTGQKLMNFARKLFFA